jgi:hypothetical protein
LCFAFSQITRTTPRRVITLHLTQIFFTDARTFIALTTLLYFRAFSFQPLAFSFFPADASREARSATIEAESSRADS